MSLPESGDGPVGLDAHARARQESGHARDRITRRCDESRVSWDATLSSMTLDTAMVLAVDFCVMRCLDRGRCLIALSVIRCWVA